MFYKKYLRHTVELHPRFLGRNLRRVLEEELRAQVGGDVVGGGVVVAVFLGSEMRTSRGEIDALTGFVRFAAEFPAIMFRAFTHEVLDVAVKTVEDQGIFAMAGPVRIFIPAPKLAASSGFDFDPASNTWVRPDTEEEIGVGSAIRVQIDSASDDQVAIASLIEVIPSDEGVVDF